MMISNSIPLEDTHQFSKIFLDYIHANPALDTFYNLKPNIESFKTQIETKEFSTENRKILKKSIENQYHKIEKSESVANNIASIDKENTYTVTTGHQLCLFTGPSYFIYKIITTVKLAQILKETYPNYNFVPVYWMATEDHDFEEINHFSLFGKKYEWQTTQKGAVGTFETKEIEKIFEILPEALPIFRKAYLEHDNLADATRFLVNTLFASYGLVIVDGNDKSLKNLIKDLIINELTSTHNFNSVQNATAKLEKAGYSGQITVREINLFYCEKGIRERIIFQNDKYKILNTELEFTKEQIIALVESNPEAFSPNVVLRPLYQEIILPNLAYIGGPGELAYWLQLKDVFTHQKLEFPVLIPRNFAMILNQNQMQKIEKLNIQIKDLFSDENSLKKLYLSNKVSIWNDEDYHKKINLVFDEMKLEASKLDKSLEGFIEAQRNEGHKIFENISRKIRKTGELKEAEGLNQLINLKTKLFPNSELQERHENILNFSIKNPAIIENLMSIFNPFKSEFHLLLND